MLDIESGIRYTLNFILDAEEIALTVRQGARELLRRLSQQLQSDDCDPRAVLARFIAEAREAFESSTTIPRRARVASAKIVLELWSQRTGILSFPFQIIFRAMRRIAVDFAFPALFESQCFQLLVRYRSNAGYLLSNALLRGTAGGIYLPKLQLAGCGEKKK